MRAESFRVSTVRGALEVAGALLSAPLSRRWYNCWGASETECLAVLPGDEIVAAPRLAYTRAVTIDAPPAAVWPWLVQIGQGRGGLYSYDGLENLVGCDIHSATRILPEHQQLAVGDQILFGPAEKGFPGQVVIAILPERAIVMCGLNPTTRSAERSATWVLALNELADGRTRLLVRGHNGYAPTLGNHLLWHLVEPIAFVMERQMLRGLKARVEDAAACAARAPAASASDSGRGIR
jgi:hypothetical protein